MFPIEGVPCCWRDVFCQDGSVVEQVGCTDDCAQGCNFVLDAPGCLALGCRWHVGGCDDNPEWPFGGRCINPPGAPCMTNGDCTDDEVCYPLSYDPCAGSDCDACSAIEYVCLRDAPTA